MHARRGTSPLAQLAVGALLLGPLLLLGGCECESQRRELDFVPSPPYPLEDDGELIVERVLRSGRDMRDQTIVERFELRRSGDYRVGRLRQEWPFGTADVELISDAEGLPIRVWRHTTMPNADHETGHHDLRVYDLTSAEDVLMARRGPSGAREGVAIRGERPQAVIAHGRGLLSVWFQAADLDVGERVREWVLDVREPVALIRPVTLERLEDQEVEGLGEVRVYTIYGREPVFADEDNVVVGDMMGLRDASSMDGPLPDPLPDPGPFDPRELP